MTLRLISPWPANDDRLYSAYLCKRIVLSMTMETINSYTVLLVIVADLCFRDLLTETTFAI